jgi:hypothetical protein
MAITPVGPSGALSFPEALAADRGQASRTVPARPSAPADRADQVSVSAAARALARAQAGAGDEEPELKLSPAQLRALVTPLARNGVHAVAADHEEVAAAAEHRERRQSALRSASWMADGTVESPRRSSDGSITSEELHVR